jgi:hypothetical protein
MLEKFRHAKLASMLPGPELSRGDRIRKLMKLRDDVRAEQRLASEATPEGEDGSNSHLGDIDIALDRLELASIGRGKAASWP